MDLSQNPLRGDEKEAEPCKQELCGPHIAKLITVNNSQKPRGC